MNLARALDVMARIKGAHVWNGDRPLLWHHEAIIPQGCTGRAGNVLCTGEVEQDGRLICEVQGWECGVARGVDDVVLPRGLRRSTLREAVTIVAARLE